VTRWLLRARALVALGVAHVEGGGRGPGGPPLDEIDARSREQLRDVLREPSVPEPTPP
jgi:hypothetical protein